MSKKPKKPVATARDPYWWVHRVWAAKCKPTVKECDRAAKLTPPAREDA